MCTEVKKCYTGSAFCRASRGLSLFLLLLLLCGTASAEYIYAFESNDIFSVGLVSYDAGGLPQTGNVLEGIKASTIDLGAYPNEKGEWRILMMQMIKSDSAFSLSLYDPDKDWKAPLGKTQNFKAYPNYDPENDSNVFLMNSGIFAVTSDDNNPSSYKIFKLNKETLAVSAQASVGSMPAFNPDEGIIYSYFNGYTEDETVSQASFTLLDEDLKDETFTYDGYYGGYTFFDDNSCALAFFSQDATTTNTTDLGIFKISGSTRTTIVSSADVGFTGTPGSWRISNLEDDDKGGLYFFVNKNTLYTLYHWDGAKTTSIYNTGSGETLGTSVFSDSGTLYFTVYKQKIDEGTGFPSGPYTSYALYRCGVSDSTPTKLHEVTDGSEISIIDSDKSGNFYFTVCKGDKTDETYTSYASYALYRRGASQTTATKLHEVKDGSGISYINKDDSGNLYFGVYPRDVSPNENRYVALYRCAPSQTVPDTVKEFTDGSIISDVVVPEASSMGIYFFVIKGIVEEEGRKYVSSLAFCHYDGRDFSTIHTFSDAVRCGGGMDERHKVLYLHAESRDVAAGTPLLVFDNTDRHNPEKLKEFNIAGRIMVSALYNDTVSSNAGNGGSSSGGCDTLWGTGAGFGALALALAAAALLKRGK